ncbi:MAG: nitrilase-related carbon-nitrogen hydrolase [Bacteroidales bacterium]
MDNLILTLLQSNIAWKQVEANLLHYQAMILHAIHTAPKESIKSSPHIFLLPEMFATGFCTDTPCAEVYQGPVFQWMQNLAIKNHISIAGSVATFNENKQMVNRFLWFRSDGSPVCYDKRHLFCMGGEDHFFSKGEDCINVEEYGWKFRLNICYDLRFPLWSRNFYNEKEDTYDYDALVYAASWPNSRIHIWNTLLAARAIENMAYCIGVNRVGKDPQETLHGGSSQIINAKGEIIAKASSQNEEILTTYLSKSELKQFRQKFPVANHWDVPLNQNFTNHI